MSEIRLSASSGLEALACRGRHGHVENCPGVTLMLRTGLSLASIMLRKGKQDALAERVRILFDIALPSSPLRAVHGPVALIWAGPGHWLAVADTGGPSEFEFRLRTELSGLAYVSDQSDGWTIIRIGGPKARDALAKGVPIDLHPHVFTPGQAAVSTAGHIGIHFWKLDDLPNYEVAVFRSFAVSFWKWLIAASGEFGTVIEENHS